MSKKFKFTSYAAEKAWNDQYKTSNDQNKKAEDESTYKFTSYAAEQAWKNQINNPNQPENPYQAAVAQYTNAPITKFGSLDTAKPNQNSRVNNTKFSSTVKSEPKKTETKTTMYGSLKAEKTDKTKNNQLGAGELDIKRTLNELNNLPDMSVQEFKEQYGNSKFAPRTDVSTYSKEEEEARKQAIKEEYESIPDRNLFERYANWFTRTNAGAVGALPEGFANYDEEYKRKQELYPEYRKIKNDEAVEDLLNKGFTEDDLLYTNKNALTQEDIDELIRSGKSEEEIEKIAEDIFNKSEEVRQRLYDYTMDQRNNEAGLSYQDYMNAIEDYYANPAVKEGAKAHPISSSILSLGTNPVEAIYSLGANAINYATGKPILNYNTTTDLMREGVNEKIGNRLGQIAYGGVMSIGDMAVAQTIDFALGGGGLISAGLQAAEKAAQVSNEGVEKGLSPNKIFAESIASGLTTFVTEKISMGKLSDIAEKGLTNYSKKEIAKTLGASFVTEGGQEGLEDIADWITNSIIDWDKNEFKKAYDEYIENGYTEDQAVAHVIGDKLVELVSDVVMGGIGGATMAGAGSGVAYYAGKINPNPHVNTDAVLESDQALAQLVEAAKTIDTSKVDEKTAKILEEVSKKDLDDVTVEDVVDLANVLNEQANPENNLAETIQEINYQANYENNINEYLETGKITEKENELPIEKAAREQAQLAVEGYNKALVEQQKQAQKDFINELKSYKKNDWQSNEDVKAQTEQSLKEASNYFENETAAKNFIDNYKGQNLRMYAEVSYLAYTAGETGQSFDTFLKNSVEADLMIKHGGVDKGYLKTLFYNGQNARRTAENTVALNKNANRGLATNLSPDDQLAVFKKAIAKKLGIEVNTNFDNAESRGNFVASLAKLVTNSTSDNEYQTIIHEMFEFARTYNAKGMELVDKTLTDMIVKKKGERSFVDAVNTYKDAYRRAGQSAPEGSDLRSEANKSASEAQDEFINDAISYIFSTDEGIQQLVDYIMSDETTTAQEKVSTIQAIKDWVDNLIKAIKNFLSGHKTEQYGYKYAEDLKLKSDELKAISLKLVSVLEDARKNLEAMTETETKSEENDEKTEKKAHSLAVVDLANMNAQDESEYLAVWDVINKIQNNKYNRDLNIPMLSYTPDLFLKVGLEDKPIYMTQKHYRDAIHPETNNKKEHYHGLKNEEIAQVPYILNHPAIIADSLSQNESVIAIGNSLDYKGRPLLAALRTDGASRGYTIEESNFMTSVYGREEFEDFINNLIKYDKILYLDDKNSHALFKSTGLQLPLSFDVLGYNKIIQQSKNIVKTAPNNSLKPLGFSGKAIKNKINEIDETVNKNQIRRAFSLDVPYEETKNLVAIHNLWDEKLKGVLELGGFPMPSIAITKADMDHSKFGDISVVFRKDTIDPKANKANKVYSGDAYTPTFPSVGYKVNKDAVWDVDERLNKIIGDMKDIFKYYGIDPDTVTDYLDRNNGNFVDAYSRKEWMKYAFIKDKGIEFNIPTTESTLNYRYDNDAIKYLALMFTADEAQRALQDSSGTYKEFSEDGRLQKIIDKINAIKKKKYGNLKLYEKLKTTELSFSEFDGLLYSIAKYYREGITQEIDSKAFNESINSIIDENKAEYEKWINDLFKGVIDKKGIRNNKEYMTSAGNRRSWDSLYDDYTLENIVKAMKGEPEVGQSLGGYTLLGSVNRKFDSIADIHSEEDRLRMMDDDEYSALRGKIQDDLYAVAKGLKPNPSWDVLSICQDIAEAAAKKKTRNGIKSFLSEWYKVSETDMDEIMRIIDEAKSLPTGYFEAKPQRAVGLDEVAAFVVPSDDTETIDLLNEKGLPVVEYERGDKQSRIDAVNSVEDVRFSIDVRYDEAYKNNDTETMDKLVEEAAREAGYDSPMLYHGTMDFGFTQIDLDKMDDKMSFFATDNLSIASSYSGTNNARGINEKEVISLEKIPEMLKDLHRWKDIREFREGDEESRYEYLREKSKSMYNFAKQNERDLRERGLMEAYSDFMNTLAEQMMFKQMDLKTLNQKLRPLQEAHYVISDYAHAIHNAYLLLGREGLGMNAYMLDGIPKSEREIRQNILPGENQGIYKFYAKTDKMLTINGKGQNWNGISGWQSAYAKSFNADNTTLKREGDIVALYSDKGIKLASKKTSEDLTEELKKDLLDTFRYRLYQKEYGTSTRQISAFAKNEGYDGVIIKDITDDGGRSNNFDHYVERGDIYIFYKPQEQVKSADTVTYDDEGNVIPLSERFKADNKDIRYSIAVTEDNTGRKLSEGQQTYFGKSVIRDKNGRLKVMYHGTPRSGFSTFSIADDGISFFFTDDRRVAAAYSGVNDMRNPDTPMSIDEINEELWNINGTTEEDQVFKSVDGKFEYWEDGQKTQTFDSLRDAQNWYFDEFINPMAFQGESGPSNYEVYLNAENPLIVEAHGGQWNAIPRDDFAKHFEKIEISDHGDGTYFVNYDEVENWHSRKRHRGETLTEAELKEVFGYGIDESRDVLGIFPSADGRRIEIGTLYLDKEGHRLPSTTREYAKYAKDNGYDGVVFNDIIDSGFYDRAEIKNNVVVVFNSNQIKSVYNENPTKNEDIRYSIDVPFFDSFEEIDNQVNLDEKDLQKLVEGISDLDSKVSQKAVDDIAGQIKKQYNSKIDKKRLAGDIMSVFRYLKATGKMSMDDVMFVMSEIARPVLEQMETTDEVQKKLYKDFVDTVKNYKISLDAGQTQEVVNAFGSYYNFVNAMRGKLQISKEGTPLDNVWTEICDKSGGALSYGTNPNDQPVALAEYIASLNPTAQELEGQDLESASTDLALEIFRQFYVYQSMADAALKVKGEITKRANEAKERYKKKYNEAIKEVEREKALNAQRLAEEIDNLTSDEQEAVRRGDTVNQALIENLKADYKRRLERLQAQQNEKIARVKAQYQNSWINKNLRRQTSELKNRLLREVKALQNMIAHPAEGASKHVPVSLINPTIEMLEAINLDNGGRNKAIADRLKKMAEVYESFKNDPNYAFDYDERIASDIEELQEMFARRSYADLSVAELQRVLEIVGALKTQIKNANNLILQDKLADARAAATEAMDQVKGSRRYDNAAMNALNAYGNLHLNAYREFRKLSGYRDGALMDIYNDLDEGSRREMQIQKDLGQIFTDVLEGQKNQKEVKKFISTKDEDLVDIGITDKNGKPIKITRAMRMSLIMHSMNAGNMRHVLGSGITIPNMYYFSKGKLDEAYAKGTNYRFVDYNELLSAIRRNDQNKISELTTKAQERVEALKKDLSAWEKKFLKDAEKMFHEETGKLVNETSLKLKGYAIARVKNYFPISSDRHFTKQEWAGLIQNASLEGAGSLKERVISTKPILLEDITNVIQRQIKFTAKYAGLAVPVRNFETVMKQTMRDQNDGQLHNLYETIDSVWGSSDTKWLQNLMKDIQGGRSEKGNFLMQLRGQFAGATLTLNPSVAMKQAASYWTAASVVGYKPLARAFGDIKNGFGGKGIEELEKINPLLWYRNQGNATQELADAKAVGFGKNLPLWAQKATNWTQWFDTGTVRTLEYAAKYYVDDNFKNLKEGSEEYWQKVSEVFSDIVEQTQPNYSTLQKADIIRNPNSFVKMLVMFKTQPMQNFGIIYDAMGELNAAKISGDKKWVNEAASKAALAVSSQAVSATVFSAMTIISQLLLHRWWKYRDEEGKWSWEKFWLALGEGVLSCMTGAFIGGSELYEALKHIFTGSTYYGIEVSVAEMVNDFVDNMGNLTKNAKALWDANTSEDREKATQKLLKASINLGATIGEFEGTPVNNIKNMLSSMYFYATDIIKSIDEGELSFSDDSNIATWDIKSQYQRIYEALQNGDTEKYNKLVKELVNEAKENDPEATDDEIAAQVEKKVSDKILNLMKTDYLEGNISDEEMMDYLVEEQGKTEDEAYLQMRKWTTGETSDYGVMRNCISTAAEDPTPENRKAVIDEIENLLEHGKDKSKIASDITKTYKEQYIELYNQGKAADLNAILRAALVAAGYTDEEAKKKLEKWLQ